MSGEDAAAPEETKGEKETRVGWLPYVAGAALPMGILAANTGQLPTLGEIAFTLVATLLGVAVLDGCARILTRLRPARELIATAAVLWIGAYGHVDEGLLGHPLGHRYMIPIWTVCFAILVLATRLAAKRAVVAHVAGFLGSFAVVLLVVQVAMVGWSLVSRSGPAGSDSGELAASLARVPPDQLPDIYYIVLDAYGRADVLDELYGFDNSAFVQGLEDLGFHVASESSCNYPATALSVPSALNMEYLHELGIEDGEDIAPLRALVNDSRVVRTLKQQGYTTVAFPTGYSVTEGRAFDRYVSTGLGLSEFQEVFVGTTILAPVLSIAASGRSALSLPPWLAARRVRLQRIFSMLPEVTRDIEGPAFVFAHLTCPHQPFIFDAEGGVVPSDRNFDSQAGFQAPTDANRDLYRESYIGQLQYVNAKTLETLRALLENRERPAVVVLQSDHGPCSLQQHEQRQEDYARERFSILNAIHLPAEVADPARFSETMSPVNSFRIVLDAYFDTSLGPIEDRSFWLATEDSELGLSERQR